MSLSIKQKAILKVIKVGNHDGTPVDMDQLLQRLPYETSKASMQFSIRALIGRGLLAKAEERKLRAGRLRVCYLLTPVGWESIPSAKVD